MQDNYYRSDKFKDLLHQYEVACLNDEPFYMDVDELMDIAEYYQQRGETEKVEEVTDRALEIYPTSTLPLAFKARLELTLHYDLKAAKRYVQMIEEKGDPEYYLIKAELLLAEDRIDDAEKLLTTAATYINEEEDNDEDFALNVAGLYVDYRVYDLARTWLDKCQNKDDEFYQELLGSIAYGDGNYDDSEKIFNHLLDKDPYSTPYWNQLANVQMMHNNIQEAIQSSEFSLAINPNDGDALLNKAHGLFNLGNYDEALKFYLRYAKAYPKDEAGMMFAGATAIYLSAYDEAIDYLLQAEQLATKLSPNLPEIYKDLAYAYALTGKKEEAFDALRKCDAGNSSINKVFEGFIYLHFAHEQEAELCFSQAREDSDNAADTNYQIAVAYLDCGRYEEAYNQFQHLFATQDSEWTRGYAYMAACCQALKRSSELLYWLKLACEKNPQEVRYLFGDNFPENVEPSQYYNYIKEKLTSENRD